MLGGLMLFRKGGNNFIWPSCMHEQANVVFVSNQLLFSPSLVWALLYL